LEGKANHTWKEFRPNFSEIPWGVLEGGTFYQIPNWQLDESAAVDVWSH